ncbi:MAG TPA: M56 family metallopeptidase [Candidatus Sulfotelmatobacter sp.]|nr:M56 family metallopeptidase [Candidatus Sulfotelmatobacter sp.]
MIGEYFSSVWTAMAPGVANHLWQSTLFAVAAGLLTLLLRKHHARARHWLWLAASLKFLLPFSLLVSIGSWLSPAPAAARASAVRPTLYFAIEEISQPFSQIGVRATPAHAPSIASTIFSQLTLAVLAIWLVGFFAVLIVWGVRWRRISAAMRQATPLSQGREIEALRRMERIGGIRRPIDMLLSRTSLEPGIFGIARPVLFWPEGISQHLDDAHLEAVFAHEIWHVRRRDNLFAALHMLVEAIFWFYPLVWWLGARLVEERERSCDEEVVALGSNRQVYAESILKVCEFCLGSPLPCVAGVTGADLKKRMVHIMTDRILHKLDFARKALLTVAATLAIAIPVTFGLFNATPSRAQSQTESPGSLAPVYSSVSVKPSAIPNGDNRTQMMFSLKDGSFMARGVTLQRLIEMAYHVQPTQISGPQDLLNKTRFDVDAKLAPEYVQQMSEHKGGEDQSMLRSILTDQFKLAVHSEAQKVLAFDLVADESGSKLQAVGEGAARRFYLGRGELSSSGAPLELLAAQLSARLGKPVVDKTGLKGTYAFNLHWTPDPSEEENLKQSGEWVAPEPVADSNGPSLMVAVQEQLGLKLVPHTEPIQVLVIDHAEAPAEN